MLLSNNVIDFIEEFFGLQAAYFNSARLRRNTCTTVKMAAMVSTSKLVIIKSALIF